MSSTPRTVKEALFAEMIGDLDSILTRIENLLSLIDGCEMRLSAASVRLEEACEKYRQAVSIFTEQAKAELSDFLDRKTAAVLEEQVTIMQQIIHDTLRHEMKGFKLNLYDDNRQSRLSRLLEQAAIALVTSLFTVFLMRLAF